jgi:hypothetical protein
MHEGETGVQGACTVPGLDGIAALRAALGGGSTGRAQRVAVQREELLAEGAPLLHGPLHAAHEINY